MQFGLTIMQNYQIFIDRKLFSKHLNFKLMKFGKNKKLQIINYLKVHTIFILKNFNFKN